MATLGAPGTARDEAAAPSISAPSGEGSEALATLPAPPGATNGDAVAAYYCHQTFRCETCLTVERLIADLLRTDFADSVAARRLLWVPLDYEQPENAVYAEAFGLKGGPAFVLSRWRAGRLVEWHEFPEIWDLSDHPTGMLAFTRDQVKLFMRAEKWHAAMDSIRAVHASPAPPIDVGGTAPAPAAETQADR